MGYSTRHVSRSEEINQSSLFNVVESVDGIERIVSRSRTSPSPFNHSVYNGRLSGFYSYGDNRSGYRSHTSQFYEYNHGGINISYPRFPQEDIPRGVHGENLHQNHPYYSYPGIPTHPNTSIPQHPHHKIPPHLYPSITPHQVFMRPYFTYTPIFAPYLVPHYPHIPPLVYLHTSFIRLPSCVLPPHYRKNMS